MSNPITTFLQALGLKSKDLTLDAQVELSNVLGKQALGLFDAAADGLEHAAALKEGIAGKYDDLADASRRQAEDAFDAAVDLYSEAAQHRQQADKIRATFGISTTPAPVAA